MKYQLIGGTRDDAVGEAFDKVAKILELGYPGGPAVARAAEECRTKKISISLTRPMMDSNNFEMSFSGIKTQVLYAWNAIIKEIKPKDLKSAKAEMAKEFQQAVVDVLIAKTLGAVKKYKVKTLLLGGGVSANKELARQMKESLVNAFPKVGFIVPEIKLTGDNAGMIALAGYYHALKKDFIKPFDLAADPNWELV